MKKILPPPFLIKFLIRKVRPNLIRRVELKIYTICKLRGPHEYSVSVKNIKLQMTYFVKKPTVPRIHVEMHNIDHLF